MTGPPLQRLAAVLHDDSGAEPLDARFRALFALKGWTASDKSTTRPVIEIIDRAFQNNDSALLKHELAYVLGQIKAEDAVACLERVLSDQGEHPMVRHEAAEAMGAISSLKAIPTLKKFLNDGNVSVRETCELALQKIEFDHAAQGSKSGGGNKEEGVESEAMALARAKAAVCDPCADKEVIEGAFLPIDPAPAHSMQTDELLASIPKYKAQLTAGDALPLFQRYRAMFSLRNAVHAARQRSQRPGLNVEQRSLLAAQADDAVHALAAGLIDKSALFRHEICFVFGELAHPASVQSMVGVLNNDEEEDMVRHEAAEALGAVAEESEAGDVGGVVDAASQMKLVMDTLQRWSKDEKAPRVVRESCIVALDEMAYNNDPSQFQPVDD